MLRRATEAGDIPGVAAMACTRDATLYEGAFGTRKLGVNKPMAIDSVVWIASMTKPITSAGIGGVYMTQILPFADVKSLPLFLDFETAVYRSLS